MAYDSPDEYLTDRYYVGVTVGRYANRISRGQIVVGGVTHQLDVNETATGNCLHGGHGFSLRFTIGKPVSIWPELFVRWSQNMGLNPGVAS